MDILNGIVLMADRVSDWDRGQSFAQKWGLYNQWGQPIVEHIPLQDLPLLARDGTLELIDGFYNGHQHVSTVYTSFTESSWVTDAPIERGGFTSLNKINASAEGSVVLCLAGNNQYRRAALQKLRDACHSLDLFTLRMPDLQVDNVTLVGMKLIRHARTGAQLAVVQLWFKEIRPSARLGSELTDPSRMLSLTRDRGMVTSLAPTSVQLQAAMRVK